MYTTPPDTKTQNRFVEKKGTYTPNLLKTAAVPQPLGAEVREN